MKSFWPTVRKMSWFTDRSYAAIAVPVRPWLPRSVGAHEEARGDVEASVAPPLAFDEGEMARVAAAMSLRATREAQAARATDPATRLAQAVECMVEALAEAVHAHVQEEAAVFRRTVALAAAIARAAGPPAGDAGALVDRISELLAGAGDPAAARLTVAPTVAEELRPILPEIAARAGFAGSLKLEQDARLSEGAAQLNWPGGWLEHDPAALAAQIEALLAAADETLPVATDGSADEHEPA